MDRSKTKRSKKEAKLTKLKRKSKKKALATYPYAPTARAHRTRRTRVAVTDGGLPKSRIDARRRGNVEKKRLKRNLF